MRDGTDKSQVINSDEQMLYVQLRKLYERLFPAWDRIVIFCEFQILHLPV